MRKPKTLEETYQSCTADGYINEIKEVNYDKIKSLMQNAETSIRTANIVVKAIREQDKEWMSVLLDHYDALRIYAEALLQFDKLDIPNHECLFAGLCIKHPQLKLDWNFLNKVRRKRNGVNYYGEHVSYHEWKDAEHQFSLCITALKKEIEKRLKF